MKRLEGKSALITGSARGIGRTFAQAYIREGATVAIADINLERAQATATELGPNAYAVEMDVTDQQSIDAAIATVIATTGKLDILINNAALFDLAPIRRFLATATNGCSRSTFPAPCSHCRPRPSR